MFNEFTKDFTFTTISLGTSKDTIEEQRNRFKNSRVFGVGVVSHPQLSDICNLGIVNNYGVSKIEHSIIRQAFKVPPIQKGSIVATQKHPSLADVGAMAILAMRSADSQRLLNLTDEFNQRVDMIAEAINAELRALRSKWKPQTLPSKENPWPKSRQISWNRELVAIDKLVHDRKVSLEDKVAVVLEWLVTGKEPTGYREKAEHRRGDLIKALENGDIKHRVIADDKIAIVESTGWDFARKVGESLAPVVVYFNPECVSDTEDFTPIRKFQITQCYASVINDKDLIDLATILVTLSCEELNWEMSDFEITSPRGVSSNLTVDKVVEIVAKNIIS